MGTKLKPGKFDCYENAAPDEPMFVLLARDPLAPILVRLWADLREHAAGNPSKVFEARECALDMEKWRHKNRSEAPPSSLPSAPRVDDQGDHVCEHGIAMDVHCCGCHSGFIFDRTHVCEYASEHEECQDNK